MILYGNPGIGKTSIACAIAGSINEKYRVLNATGNNKKDIEVCQEKDKLISIADAKLSVYKIDDGLRLKIKKSNYSLEEILGNKDHLEDFKNGLCLVFRLCVDDYHRYCHIDDGELVYDKVIKGKLHTVRPISSRYKVFKENQREYMILNTENLGEMIYMEVGAMQIGKINNHDLSEFKKGQEKGYFSYGASTIVIIVQNVK